MKITRGTIGMSVFLWAMLSIGYFTSDFTNDLPTIGFLFILLYGIFAVVAFLVSTIGVVLNKMNRKEFFVINSSLFSVVLMIVITKLLKSG